MPMPTSLIRKVGVAGLVLLAGGCDSWFDPSTDDIVDPDALRNAAAIQTLLAGARRDFALAYVGFGDGSTEGSILMSGLVADEFDNSDTFPTRQEMDQRAMDVRNLSVDDIYTSIQRARVAADAAATRARALTPTAVNTIAELHILSGMSILILAEDFCSGVPLSHVDTAGVITYDIQRTTEELYTTALAKFDSASAIATDPTFAYAADVGAARALLGLDQPALAAARVAAVPTEFRYSTVHGTATLELQNAVFTFVNEANRWTVGSGFGGGIDFVFDPDPRVPVDPNVGVGFDGFTPQHNQLVYPTFTTPVPILSGVEARLIEAEAMLSSDPTGSLDILNDLRNAIDMSDLAFQADPVARQDQLFLERAYWLYATDRRLGDLRRLMRFYGRLEDDVFPTGEYFKGGFYGDDVNVPVPASERNNPNIGLNGETCIDRGP